MDNEYIVQILEAGQIREIDGVILRYTSEGGTKDIIGEVMDLFSNEDVRDFYNDGFDNIGGKLTITKYYISKQSSIKGLQIKPLTHYTDIFGKSTIPPITTSDVGTIEALCQYMQKIRLSVMKGMIDDDIKSLQMIE